MSGISPLKDIEEITKFIRDNFTLDPVQHMSCAFFGTEHKNL